MKLCILGLSAAVLVACNQPVLPTIDKVINVVTADLQATPPASDSQIDSDVCKALGGSAATDAVCADVPVLVADAIAILIDTGTIAGPAMSNARAYQARHPGGK